MLRPQNGGDGRDSVAEVVGRTGSTISSSSKHLARGLSSFKVTIKVGAVWR